MRPRGFRPVVIAKIVKLFLIQDSWIRIPGSEIRLCPLPFGEMAHYIALLNLKLPEQRPDRIDAAICTLIPFKNEASLRFLWTLGKDYSIKLASLLYTRKPRPMARVLFYPSTRTLNQEAVIFHINYGWTKDLGFKYLWAKAARL